MPWPGNEKLVNTAQYNIALTNIGGAGKTNVPQISGGKQIPIHSKFILEQSKLVLLMGFAVNL